MTINKRITEFPKTVDCEVNGACNLRCPWCWGPSHTTSEMTLFEWEEILKKLKTLGTKGIIITGGEPLLRNDLMKFIMHAKQLGFRNTLSTNGILLERHKNILPYVDDVGIPLDGYNMEVNNTMRVGTAAQFKKALKGLQIIQEKFPQIVLTVRTVIARKNMSTAHLIGQTLIENAIDPKQIRWKIYQCSPANFEGHGYEKTDDLISSEEFFKVINLIRETNPLFTNIKAFEVNEAYGRYFRIEPNGNTSTIVQGPTGKPRRFHLGSVLDDGWESIINNMANNDKLLGNIYHGV